jgi:hypothetical protein
MSRTILGSVVGALAVTALAVPIAHAARPAKVNVRVVGPRGPLAGAIVTTTTRRVTKDGTHSCSGTSAAGALDQVTDGRWTGTWYDGMGYALDSVEGVRATLPDYWTLWVNERASMTGLCDTELQPGDDVLQFVCTDAKPPTYACANRPLGVIAPKRAKGTRLTVRSVAFNDDGTTVPAPGTTISGGVTSVKTNARGTATVRLFGEGQTALVATRAGDVDSAPALCTVTSTATRCGGDDGTAPTLKLAGIRDGQVFTAAKAPRVLHGVARDPSGVMVELKLARRANGSCAAFVGRLDAFVRCPRGGARWFMASDRERWSYLLPKKLAPGRYTLGVLASDANENVRRLTVHFRVKAAR